MDITSTVEQVVKVTIAPKTLSGNPATLDGKPEWSIPSGNATIRNISTDGLSAEIVSEDTIGSSTWKVTADADLGEGVRTIEEGGTYNYTNAEAAALGATTEVLPK